MPSRCIRWLKEDARGEKLVRGALILFFLWLAGRHWHPHYGFTRLLQMDAAALATATPVLRDAPIYTYRDAGGYDGHYYGQLASDPTLSDPQLGGGMDNYSYRARRILGSALAHLLAGGDRIESVRLYAALNLAVWLALAAVLWRLLPPGDWRATAAWAAVLFTVGTLHAVRCALPDLPALLGVALGLCAVERGRWVAAGLAFALAALARETSLLAAALAAAHLVRQRQPRAALTLGALASLPVAAWLLFIRLRLGQGGGGWDNFTLPLTGWLGRWSECFANLRAEPDRLLAIATLLGLVALTVQAACLLLKRTPANIWWWVGAGYAAFMFTLNRGVWEGLPGAAPRVVLPLTLAFAVLAARQRMGWLWLAGGSLGVLGGVLTLWAVPAEPHELAAGRAADCSYVVHTADGFHPTERHRSRAWAWCATEGSLVIHTWPAGDGARDLILYTAGITDRPLEVRQDGRLLWRGALGAKPGAVPLHGVVFRQGRARLDLRSPAAPLRETARSARELGLALYGLEMR